MKKKLILRSSIFFWRNEKEALFYDSASGASFHYSISCPEIVSLCSQWEELDNLYAAHYDAQSGSPEFFDFVNELTNRGFASVHDEDEVVVAFPPILCIDFDANQLSSLGPRGFEKQPVLPYINKITAYLGGLCDDSDWYRQCKYPMSSTSRLDVHRLMGFLSQCSFQALAQIDLIISDWNSTIIKAFAKELDVFKEKVHFFFTHPNPLFHNEIIDILVDHGYAITQVCPPNPNLNQATWIPGRNYHLLVRSEDDYAHWESLMQEKAPEQYEVIPIADNNVEFFRSNVFLSEEEILGQKLTKKDIFRHQALNVNHFGTFFIFPDGTIHPAADAPSVGTLEDSVHQTIIRELVENHAWRQTRRDIEPCKNCLYHDLCPSPSVYERILGVPGCTVNLKPV